MRISANLPDQKLKLSQAKGALLEKHLRGQLTAGPATEIIPRKPEGPAPLSFSQQRLWFLNRLEGGNVAYNVPNALLLTGQLDIRVLERAFNEIIRRHEILRTTFEVVDGKPVQCVAPELRLSVEVHDMSRLPASGREAEIIRRAKEEGGKPFDLAKGPLLRISLLDLGERQGKKVHVLLFTFHHIIADGWSAGILFQEFAAFYRSIREGRASPLPELPIQYRDFAHWQRQWLKEEHLEQQLAYWRKQMDGAPPLLELPTDHPRPAVQTDRGTSFRFRISRSLTERLHGLSRDRGVTLFVTLVSAFNALLYRYSGQTDLCLGVSVANRTRSEIESLIGLFVNMLVFRADLSGNPRFTELLSRMEEVSAAAQGHQDLPFEKLIEDLNPARDRSYSPFFQVVLVLHNMPIRELAVSELTVQRLDVDYGTTKSDLTLHLTEANGLEAVFEYSTELFEPATIARMAGHLESLLEAVAEHPESRLSELPLLTEAERCRLAEWNATAGVFPQDANLHEVFETRAKKHPKRTAVVCGERRLSYGELNQRANRLARYLGARGVGPEVRFGLCAERSIEAVVGILGILKAEGAYVPVDPSHPPERTAELPADSGAGLLLTQERLAARCPAGIEIL